MRKSRLTGRRKRELKKNLYKKPLIALYLFFMVLSLMAGNTNAAFNDIETVSGSLHVSWPIEEEPPEEWDKSSLEFIKPNGYEEDYIFTTVTNGGDGDMEGTSEYQVYFVPNSNANINKFKALFGEDNVNAWKDYPNCSNSNPHKTKMQVLLYEGTIPALESGSSVQLSYDFDELSDEEQNLIFSTKGSYDFIGYHRPGHSNNYDSRQCIADRGLERPQVLTESIDNDSDEDKQEENAVQGEQDIPVNSEAKNDEDEVGEQNLKDQQKTQEKNTRDNNENMNNETTNINEEEKSTQSTSQEVETQTEKEDQTNEESKNNESEDESVSEAKEQPTDEKEEIDFVKEGESDETESN